MWRGFLISLSAVQARNSVLQLGNGVLLRPALAEVGILSGNRLAGKGVLHKSLIRNAGPDTPGKSALTAKLSIAVWEK